MATLASIFPTLVDVTKRLDPNGTIAPIAELLSKYLPLLEDMAWYEGNLPTGHRYTALASTTCVPRRGPIGITIESSAEERT